VIGRGGWLGAALCKTRPIWNRLKNFGDRTRGVATGRGSRDRSKRAVIDTGARTGVEGRMAPLGGGVVGRRHVFFLLHLCLLKGCIKIAGNKTVAAADPQLQRMYPTPAETRTSSVLLACISHAFIRICRAFIRLGSDIIKMVLVGIRAVNL
jgi:hypothetical protein